MKYPNSKKTYPTYQSQSFGGIVVADNAGNKKIQINSKELYQHFIKTNCQKGDLISMYITNKRPQRTQKQNRFLWVYYGIVANETGHTTEEIHDWAKGKFLTQGITEVFGSKVRKLKSTTQLTKQEFSEYIERIESETGVPAPIVDEDYDIRKMELI